MTQTPVKKVLHVLGDKSWKPEYRFLGSTKDIVGRRDYFADRGIEFVELQVKGRHDYNCLEMLQQLDLSDFDAVLMEHPRYPKSMAYLKKTYPRLLRMIRGHNAELIHQLHTAWAYWNSGLSGPKWRWKRTRMTLKNVLDRFGYDVSCARLADYVLAICDWEAERYWPWLTPRRKILVCPYFVPDSYAVQPPADQQKVQRVLCTMSADWTPLAHHAAKVLVEVVKKTPPEKVKGWKFAITGDLGKHRDSYKTLKSQGRVAVMGNVDNPFETMMQSRVLAHLSNLGMGFKTKLLDFVNGGGWVLTPRTLYKRQPAEMQPFCIIVDPVSPDGLARALKQARQPWPDNTDVNSRLRQRAFAALDRAFGRA